MISYNRIVFEGLSKELPLHKITLHNRINVQKSVIKLSLRL